MFEPDLFARSDDRARLRPRAWGSIGVLGLALGGSGCAVEPLPCLNLLQEGDLVITEIRGPQDDPNDTRGEWFELYNPTNEVIDLYGVQGVLVNLKGSNEITFIVREPLEVAPADYVVLGSLASPPPEVDYSFNDDFKEESRDEVDTDGTVAVPGTELSDPRELFSNARFELRSCGRRIDAVVYAELPGAGTYSFQGPPDPVDNDDPGNWCTDDREAPPDGPQTELGLPGSPGEANPPCP